MNRSIVRFLIAKLLLIEAALLVVPLIVALIYQENAKVFASILGTMGILLFLGVLGTLFKPKNYHIYTKEGMLIVALCWVLWSFFGGLPFVFAGQIPSVIDAFFEMSSGFTTTGATILTDTGVLTHSLLFWRSFAHLIGGMGVLVFALAIMNNSKNGHHEVMRAEVPGPVFGKVVAKLKNTAQILYIIYLTMFVIFAVILWLCGTAKPENNSKNNKHSQIDDVKNLSCIFELGNDFTKYWTRHLCTHNLMVTIFTVVHDG